MNVIESSELIINSRGAIYHLDLRPEEIGDTIITVGDPFRVENVSKHFDQILCKSQHREFVSHTGRVGNKIVSVISTGIGPDNIDIVINELDALVNINLQSRTIKPEKKQLKFIRVGTSGSLQPNIDVDNFVASTYGIGLDNLMHYYPTQLTEIELELLSEGYEITVAHDGMSGLALLRESPPDLAILDWMLPGLSGLEICRRLRATGNSLPVILLTAKDEISDRVAGLDAGADDYVVKPFSIEELLARIRAHLRRKPENNADFLQFEDLSLNLRTREVYRGQRAIELTVKEFDLLEYLLSHPRQVLTREQILERVWGYDFLGDSNIIEVYIRYLRLKIEGTGEKRLIHTVRSVGYVLSLK
jgi:DNA-binding response OmpR family regulator